MKAHLRRWWRVYRYESLLSAVIVVLYSGMAVWEPLLRDPENLLDATQHIAEIGIMAVAMTPIIVTAGIDLSVGAILGLSGIVLGYSWKECGAPLWLACGFAVLTGTLAGAANGLAITLGRVPPLVVTLATMAIFRGLAFALAFAISTQGSFSGFPLEFEELGLRYVPFWPLGFPTPLQFYFLLAAVLVGYVCLHRTVLGRYVYAIGSNETAARFAAVPVNRVRMVLYTLSGATAGLCAIVFTARSSTAKPDAALGYELDVITCVVLGGTSITGGRGTILGTFLGVIAVLLVRTGLGYAGVPDVWRALLLGLLLVVTACANQLFTRPGRT